MRLLIYIQLGHKLLPVLITLYEPLLTLRKLIQTLLFR